MSAVLSMSLIDVTHSTARQKRPKKFPAEPRLLQRRSAGALEICSALCTAVFAGFTLVYCVKFRFRASFFIRFD